MLKTKTMGNITALRLILSFVMTYKSWFSLSVLTTGTIIVINLVKAWFTKELVDTTMAGETSKLPILLLIFLAVISAGTILTYLRALATGRFSEYALKDIKDKLAERVSAARLTALADIQSGDMASRLNTDTETVGRFMKNDLPGISMHILMGLAASVYIATISWQLLLVSLTITPLAMILAYWLNTKAGKHYPMVYKLTGKATGELEQSIQGIDTIRSYNLQNLFGAKFRTMYRDIFSAEMRAQRNVAILQPVCFALVYFPRLFCVLYGGYMVYTSRMEVGTVIIAIQLLEYTVPPTVLLPFFMNNLKKSLAAIGRVCAVFDLPQERSGGKTQFLHPLPVQFVDTFFAYIQGEGILNGVSFSLEPGTVTALVGVSGSGKTTTTKLIAGLMEGTQGNIQVFGTDIREWDLQTLREHLAVVGQHNYLFPGTIAENIGYGKPGAAREDVVAAARAAYAHDFILEMPRGYDTLITENGADLSGGQRQRIAIARAILRNAPIVILDEPTSALDNQAETRIQKSIENLARGRTMLVVAHRLSTIENADKIIVLNQGKVVETGTHSELVRQKGFYYKLYHSQFTA